MTEMYKTMRVFSTTTPDLGQMIGRNQVDSKVRTMPGLAKTRSVEMMNAKKIAIANYENVFLRSTIMYMRDEKVRREMRADLMNTVYMTEKMWQKFDGIIHHPKTRFDAPGRHLWDFPCLSYSLEARNRRTIAALIIWLRDTHGLTQQKWDESEVLKTAKAVNIGNVIAFQNPDAKHGDIGYSLGIVFQLPEPFSEFKEFDATFHVDRLHPVDSFGGTNHKGVGSGTWWRNGPSKIKEGDVISEESIDVVQIEPEKILWSEMQWGGLARPIIELTGPAKLNFHRQCSVWKLKSSVNTLIMRERLGIKNFSPGKHSTYTMRKTNGGITMRDSRKK